MANPALLTILSKSRNRCRPGLSISAKIRVHDDVKETVELCRRLEKAGLDSLTVHGRTVRQRAEPVDLQKIRAIKDSLAIPVVANGDVRGLLDARRTREATGCDGVMAARGALENPAMFHPGGQEGTPEDCVKDWIREDCIRTEGFFLNRLFAKCAFPFKNFLAVIK